MPRLPVEYNETLIPRSLPGLPSREVALPAAGEAAGALAQGAYPAGAQVGRGLASIAEVEAEKAKFAAGTQAMDLFTNAAQRVEDLHLSLKTAPDADPQTHVARFEQGFKDIAAEELQKTDNPLVRQTTQRLLDRLKLESTLQARKDANTMFIDGEKASVAQSLENMAKAAGEATTPQGRDFYTGMAQGYLASKRGVLSSVEIQRLGTNFQQRVAIDGVRKQIDADPFVDADPFMKNLNDENAHRMTEYQTQKQTQWIAKHDTYQKSLDKEQESQRQQILTDAESRALKGQFSVEALDGLRRARWIQKPDEYKRLYDIITAGPKEHASDQATLDRVIADTRSDVPRMSEGQLNSLHDAGHLNTKDWKEALDARRTRMNYLEGRFNTDENRIKAEQESDLTKARALGQAAFQIPAIYDRLEGNKGKVWSAYLDELISRTKRGENPVKVANEIIPHYKDVLGTESLLKKEELQKVLYPYQSPDELDAALARAEITRGEYEAKQRRFQELRDVLNTENAVYGPQSPAPAAKPGIGARIRSFLPSGKPPENLGRK